MHKNMNIPGLSPSEELDVYLVLNKLKPSAIVGLNPLFLGLNEVDIDLEGKINIYTIKDIILSEGEVKKFKKTLNNHELKYIQKRVHNHAHETAYNTLINYTSQTFYVATNDNALINLQSACRSGSHEAAGLALGYPKLAAKYFLKEYNGKFISGINIDASIKKAILADVNIPSWLGYINYVPAKFDIINNDIDPETVEQGLKYESFVKETNPNLAIKIDAKFKEHLDYWKNTNFLPTGPER